MIGRDFLRDFAIAIGALIAGTLIAELLGSVDLGTALTFGSIVIRGPRSGDPPA